MTGAIGNTLPNDRQAPNLSSDPAISVLSDSLSNQIAAGEVVTRPAAVVKELVENALDAGATSITVDVQEGGSRLIRVVDDGHGMSRENAAVCVRRHATSKIATKDDLLSIDTLGFRGEALPSIASVSRFVLTTRPPDQEEATEVRIDGGSEPRIADAASAPGTRIEVSDLFFNVPARRKFLKTVATEFSQIKKIVLALALGFPYVRMSLTHNGRKALQFTPARNLRERAFQVFGKKTASLMHPVEASAPIQLHGLISEASSNRASRAGIFAFVNGRYVRDRVVTHALVSAYSDTLPKGRFPEAVLYIHLPTDEVDVNTHPTKEEIRFSHPGSVHQTIASAVANTLRSEPWLLVPRHKREERPRIEPLFEASTESAYRFEYPTTSPPSAPNPVEPDTENQPGVSWSLIGLTSRGDAVVETGNAIQLVSTHEATRCLIFGAWWSHFEQGPITGLPLLFPSQVEFSAAHSEALRKHSKTLRSLGFELDAFGGLTWQISALPEPLSDQDPTLMACTLAESLLQHPKGVEPSAEAIIRSVSKACSYQGGTSAEQAEALVRSLGQVSPSQRLEWALGPSLFYEPPTR
jgi:DNA mismatch repair protein MutL